MYRFTRMYTSNMFTIPSANFDHFDPSPPRHRQGSQWKSLPARVLRSYISYRHMYIYIYYPCIYISMYIYVFVSTNTYAHILNRYIYIYHTYA